MKCQSFVCLLPNNIGHISRNKIKALIEHAVKSDARLIVVDVDLSQQTPVVELKQHPYDQELYNYIANYKKSCQDCPPIILARAFRPLPESAMTEAEPIREVRTGFLEKAVAQSAPHVQWASPLFIRSSYDNVIRRWWLWQPVCADKQPQVLPSIELLAWTWCLDRFCLTFIRGTIAPNSG